MHIKCLVACINSNGEPELVHVTVECTQVEYDNGYHYDKAKEFVEGEGYENPAWVADENDPGFINQIHVLKASSEARTDLEHVKHALIHGSDHFIQYLFECWDFDESIGLLSVTGAEKEFPDLDFDEEWRAWYRHQMESGGMIDVADFAEHLNKSHSGRLTATRVWCERLYT